MSDTITISRAEYGDLLYAAGELDSIKVLVSDRHEVGTYAKVEALIAIVEQKDERDSQGSCE